MSELQLNVETNARQAGNDMAGLANKTKKSASQFENLSGSLKKTALQFFGAQGLINGVKTVINDFDKASQKARSFTQSITGLTALGGDIAEIRKEVNALRLETGESEQNIADTIFTVRSGASDLGKEIQDQLIRKSIELSKVWGGDLPAVTNAMVTTWNIYGDELKNVEMLQSKLNIASVVGKLEMQDIARLMPRLQGGAKALGVEFDDLTASFVAASKKSGDLASTATGIRNVLAILSEAEEQGFKTTGSLAERLEQFASSGSILSRFGRESVDTASNLADSIRSGEFEKIKAQISGVTGKEVTERRNIQLADEGFRKAEDLLLAQARRDVNQSGRTLGTDIEIKTTELATELEEIGGGSAVLGGAKSLSPITALTTIVQQFLKIQELNDKTQQQTSVNQLKTSNADRGN